MQLLKHFIHTYDVDRRFPSQFLIVNGRLNKMMLKHCVMISPEYYDYTVYDWTHDSNAIVIHIKSKENFKDEI